jgi:hypothetical protein
MHVADVCGITVQSQAEPQVRHLAHQPRLSSQLAHRGVQVPSSNLPLLLLLLLL